MTTMTCERFTDGLMAYLERDTDEATRAAMDRHAAGCAACRTLLADLRRLERDAAALPELAPSRDLWAGIAERIEPPVVSIAPVLSAAAAPVAPRAWAARRWTARRLMNAGLLAASLAGAVTLGYVARGERAPAGTTSPVATGGDTLVREPVRQVANGEPVRMPPATAEPTPTPVSSSASRAPSTGTTTIPGAPPTAPAGTGTPGTARATAVQYAAATLTADYDREIATLRGLMQQRRVQLDSATLAVIERNLAVIDSAIADSRRAIAADPSSPYLIELLNHSLQTKVELMRTAALLPSRT